MVLQKGLGGAGGEPVHQFAQEGIKRDLRHRGDAGDGEGYQQQALDRRQEVDEKCTRRGGRLFDFRL